MTRYTLSLWLFNLNVSYIIQYAGLDKSQAGIKIAGRSINIHIYKDDTALTAESKKELKSLSMRRGDEETSLNLTFKTTIHKKTLNSHGIQFQHFMAYRWGKSGNSGSIFLGFKITMDLDCSHKTKIHLLLGRKKGSEKPAQCIKKQRHTLLQRSVESKLWFFPVIRYRCVIWTIRNSECQRIELLNCGAWEDTWESFIQQGDQTSLKGNQPLTTAVSAEASTESLQGERTDSSTAKVPNHGSSKQTVCSPTHGESQKGWRLCVPWVSWYMHCILPSSIGGQERGILGPGGGGWLRDPLGPSLTK